MIGCRHTASNTASTPHPTVSCCSNKDTSPVDHLDTLSPEERLTLFTNLGTLLLLAEVLLCWLFGEMDPLGESTTDSRYTSTSVGTG